jgi:uncharacterized protein
MKVDAHALTAKLTPTFERMGVRLAYLFGSQATGHTRADSDVDIAVLFADTVSDPERSRLASDLLGEICQTLSSDCVEIVLLNDCAPLLAFEVVRSGRLLFASDDFERIDFQVRTIRALEDTQPLRALLREAMSERIRRGVYGKPGPARSTR